MALPYDIPAFSHGEITPALWGRVDLALFSTALATARNGYVDYRGGFRSRAGTSFVGRALQTPAQGDGPPRLINFSFSLEQQYMIELGSQYARFVYQGGYVTESPFAVTAATNADPSQITAPGHNFNNGDWAFLTGLGGIFQVQGIYIVQNANQGAGTFTLADLTGSPIDSTLFAVYTGGGAAARIYTIEAPYINGDWWNVKWTQSADVMTLTHPMYPPWNLNRFGGANWSFSLVSIGSKVAAPSSAAAIATVQPSGATSPPTLPCAYAYVVTSVNTLTGEESLPSPIANLTNGVDMAATAGSNIVSWAPISGITQYNIYRAPTSYNTDPTNPDVALPVPVGALFGLVGSSLGTQFVDNNITADVSISPPQFQNPFAPGQVTNIFMTASSGDWTMAAVSISSLTGTGFIGEAIIQGGFITGVLIINPGQGYVSGNTVVFTGDGTSASATLLVGPATGTYPSAGAYFQQRRAYFNSLNNPETDWLSQPGSYDNFDTSIPVGDSDAITGTLATETVDGIQYALEMPLGLVTFTGSRVLQITASGTSLLNPAAITPSNQIAVPQSTVGSSSTLAPQRVNWDILHYEPDNATLREMNYQIWFNIYTTEDKTWQSSHLTFGHQLVDRAWCRKPSYLLWQARDDGMLLAFTYLKEQQVAAWTRQTTQGKFRAMCAVTELPVDALYLCVERSDLNGTLFYSIERMNDRIWLSVEDPWCIDFGVSTSLSEGNVTLFADAATGTVNFTAVGGAYFNPGHVGQVLRMGGGIAAITTYNSGVSVSGAWVYPCQEITPDDPLGLPLWQDPGAWTIAPNITTLSGFDVSLLGKTVIGLADGVPIGPLTVQGGNGYLFVTLPFPASDVKMGLGFTVQAQSVYLDAGQPTIQGRRKSVSAVTGRIEASAPMQLGANQVDVSAQSSPGLSAIWSAGMTTMPASPTQLPAPYPSPGTYLNPAPVMVQPLFTGDVRIPIPSDWIKKGQIAAQQTQAQPLNLLSFIPEVLVGDTPEDIPPPQRSAPIPPPGSLTHWPQQGPQR
jgi:hypothetical protein